MMIRHWVVLDLDVFRRHENDAGVRREIQSNADGTHFIAYDILSFPPELLVATSATMAIALAQGITAVKPLRPRYLKELDDRWRQRLAKNPPPDLQEWVARYGGYHKIPWAEWDAAMALWQQRRGTMS